MFLPQRPYLSPGTLRDQVIYPDGHVDMREKRKSEDDLKAVLDAARLGYLPDREGGWDTRKEWKDVLSGGEKQRMGFARLLYHEPQYAIIDEGTSAVSSDVEGLLYETCKDRGISKSTIKSMAQLHLLTHRSSHHNLYTSIAKEIPHLQPRARLGRAGRRVGV
jgi:ATP-binding cassette, subfamily D (ALD), peroxisomal long-chain fatty acid import protein